ncbi:MAG: TRAP transporter fused permease subunit, partial [Candidatus Rokubacteria bacterium]|nr:TRAP transporter fused permease subunit [Candidatus Rokubacteria bacterium]
MASARVGRWSLVGLGLAWALFQLASAFLGSFDDMVLLPGHVAFAASMAMLARSLSGNRREETAPIPVSDLLLAIVPLAAGGYLLVEQARLTSRISGVDPVTTPDVVIGVSLILLVVEACRRTAGSVLTGLAVVFVVYAFAGPYLWGPFQHRGISLLRFVDLQVLSTEGMFGIPTSASANMVFYFVLVGAFLERSGAGQLFISVAYSLTGRARGGSAKASVISSALFGTVSGSAVANVLVDGWLTIPLMKRTGFSPSVAGAIEAVASTGGQIMPPVMGAAAFVLAQIVGVSYWNVVVAAAIPAILYYVSLYFMVDFHSRKEGLRTLQREEIADLLSGMLDRVHMFFPLAYLIYLLSQGYTLMSVGLRTVIAIILVSLLRRATRMGVRQVVDALYAGARAAVDVAVPSAIAGIIVGTLVHTGLAIRFKEILLALTGGLLLPSLVVAMVVTLILGMGMPTTAAYLLAAILVAPAIQGLGVPALAIHLFLFYFGVVSMVTPPVALAAFAAAGISGANLWSTGIQAFKFSLAAFLVPYAFVYNQALLLTGPWGEIAWVVSTTAVGVAVLAAAVVGYAYGPTRP